MKKSLLLTSALLVSAASFAQDAATAEPQVLSDFYALGISPNGVWLAGQAGAYSVAIRNLETGKTYIYEEDDLNTYGVGSGQFVSNTGIVLGTTDNMNAAYWKDGEWYELTSLVEGTTNGANSILADGSMICGNVGMQPISTDASAIMCVPAVWYQQSDGTYGDPVLLPHPDFDFTGRIPQYITAVSMSEDGNTVIGQIQDFAGFNVQLIKYTRNSDGEWTYALIHPELTNPNNVEFPEYPGEWDKIWDPTEYMTEAEIDAYDTAVNDYWNAMSAPYPEAEQFMSDDELEAYMAALNEYYETWENYPEPRDYMTDEEWDAYMKALDDYDEKVNNLTYPEYTDYMTAEELEQYNAAKEIYDAEEAEWQEKYNAFEEAFMACLADGYTYEYNNFRISPDGKMAATTRQATVPNDDPMAWMPFKNVYMPVIFNLDDDTFTVCANAEDMIISYISEDYTVLASHEDPNRIYPRRAYVVSEFETTPLEDYVGAINTNLGEWMTENMMHNIPVDIDWDIMDYIYADYMCSGVPTATPDMSIIVTGLQNTYDFDDPTEFYSYIIPVSANSGVENVAVEGEFSVNVIADGTIVLGGEFKSVDVYNVAGLNVLSVENPASNVATGLSKGLYIVKAVTAEGNSIVRKFTF